MDILLTFPLFDINILETKSSFEDKKFLKYIGPLREKKYCLPFLFEDNNYYFANNSIILAEGLKTNKYMVQKNINLDISKNGIIKFNCLLGYFGGKKSKPIKKNDNPVKYDIISNNKKKYKDDPVEKILYLQNYKVRYPKIINSGRENIINSGDFLSKLVDHSFYNNENNNKCMNFTPFLIGCIKRDNVKIKNTGNLKEIRTIFLYYHDIEYLKLYNYKHDFYFLVIKIKNKGYNTDGIEIKSYILNYLSKYYTYIICTLELLNKSDNKKYLNVIIDNLKIIFNFNPLGVINNNEYFEKLIIYCITQRIFENKILKIRKIISDNNIYKNDEIIKIFDSYNKFCQNDKIIKFNDIFCENKKEAALRKIKTLIKIIKDDITPFVKEIKSIF
jgi:hypothetical protein